MIQEIQLFAVICAGMDPVNAETHLLRRAGAPGTPRTGLTLRVPGVQRRCMGTIRFLQEPDVRRPADIGLPSQLSMRTNRRIGQMSH